MAAAALLSGEYTPPKITDFGSILENTFANPHVFPGFSVRVHCNSGRGNGSEGPDTQLIDPHDKPHKGLGPGISPTVDCDPGNSGNKNKGGD
jgi:hypothetical protein